MSPAPDTLRLLAEVLAYPGPGFTARAAECAEALAATDAGAAQRVARFATFALASGDAALEEAYTSAFDLAPVCSPYVGDQLFGASRERSFLLSGLRELQRGAGVAGGVELADHVSEVLRLVAAPIPDDVREDLVRDGLVPALRKMLAALDEARHPWADVVGAAVLVVEPSAGSPRAPVLEVSP